MKKFSQSITYVGVNDKKIDLFEGMYNVPDGISYNSYVLIDKKIAVFDTVAENFKTKWLGAIKRALGERKPNYLIITHMEPDHSANVANFIKAYPRATIVGNRKIFVMLEEYFGKGVAANTLEVADGDELKLGTHTLKFIFAPMVHWPEVMTVYEKKEKILFSADAFGKFGALDVSDIWEPEARRYYYGIVGKYGKQVAAYLKKVGEYPIETICPLHGPVLSENIEHYISLYDKWANYRSEADGVFIAYSSVYGHTEQAALKLKAFLKVRGVQAVTACDISRTDWSLLVSESFRFNKLVLATTTYNGALFPAMRNYLETLTERNFCNRKVALIENGSWAPVAAKLMKEKLSVCKGIEFVGEPVKIHSALTQKNLTELETLADELSK